MTSQQLINFLRGKGFTANEMFHLMAEILPTPFARLTVKELRPWVKNWKQGFKRMKRWRDTLDETQKRQDEAND